MNRTASDLPELRSDLLGLRPDPLGPRTFISGERSYVSDLLEVLTSGLIAATGKPTEHWALQGWGREGEHVWVNLDATGVTIIDPASHRHLTMHHFAVDTLPADLFETMDELNALTELLPGWNGYDVAAPKTSSILEAKKWIREMYEDATRMRAPWRKPHVAADENGDVTFEWWSGDKGLTIYISEPEVIYLKDWGPNILTEMEDGPVSTSEERRELWTWLTS
jgi:hypothetical protein